MSINTRILHSQRGAGMILAFLVITVIFACGMSFLGLAITSLAASKRDVNRVRALACAESGVDIALHFIMDGGPNGEQPGT